MADIIHRVGIKARPANVYEALSTIEGLAKWWTEDTAGGSQPGEVIQFRFRSNEGSLIGGMDMKVLSLEPEKSVVWRCQQGPSDWIGTELTFNLIQDGEFTIVLFAHKNWENATESMAHCSTKWATFLLSLRDLVEKGKGKPSPHDVKIDNWN